MAELGPAYFQEAFDPVAGEMARLPPAFDAALLDALVDRRSWVLEVRLSPLPLPPPPSLGPAPPDPSAPFLPYVLSAPTPCARALPGVKASASSCG